MIPSMGGDQIGDDLYTWAAAAPQDTAIVELGAWLGAGTYHLARGAQESGVKVHTFDAFEVRKNEVDKLKFAKIRGFDVGRDTLPLVKYYLRGVIDNIVFHKGRIPNFPPWKGLPISIHVDDVCKREFKFNWSIETFAKYWIPKVTVVVLMDFFWSQRHLQEPDAQVQPNFIRDNPDKFTQLKVWKTKGAWAPAAFLYQGGFE